MQIFAFLKVFILVSIISLINSIIFLFVTPPQSYFLFFLLIFLTMFVIITILGDNISISIDLNLNSFKLHIFLIILSIILFLTQLLNIYIESLNMILYIVIFTFSFGFYFLNIIKFRPLYSYIEFIALSYPLSIASISIFGAVILFLPSYFRGLALTSIIIFISLISLFITIKEKRKGDKLFKLIITNNHFIMFFILLIFLTFFTTLYPKISDFLGLDIARNFIQALAFTRNTFGDFYDINSFYPLFGIFQSYIINIVKPSIATFQDIAIFLNLLAILSFYSMASQYLKRYGENTPVIATFIWATFAGFGWLDFLIQRISNPSSSLLMLIGQADTYSYGDITWRRLFFYLSMEVSLTIVFAVLYLLKRDDLPKNKLIFLLTLLLTPLPLLHPYGTYFLFSILLCFIIFCSKEMKSILKYTAYSLLIVSFSDLTLNYILYLRTQIISINFLTFYEYLLMSLVMLSITIIREYFPKKNIMINYKVYNNKYIKNIFLTLSLIVYFSALLFWINGGFIFNFFNLNIFGYVPWILYPIKLGVVGILVIISIYFLLYSNDYSREIWALLASAILMIFVSRLVSTLQMQYISEFIVDSNSFFETIIKTILSFREERMFELYKIPLAIIASIFFSKISFNQYKINWINNKDIMKIFLVSSIISLVLISGVSSTLLGFEDYKNIVATSQPNPLELDAINKLRDNISINGKAVITSPQTNTPSLDFTGATSIVTESPAAWVSNCPELPLFVTRFSKITPTYFYFQKNINSLNLPNSTRNYLDHLSSSTQTFIENQAVRITTINNITTPTPESSTALIIPYDMSTMDVSNPLYSELYRQFMMLGLFFERNMQSMNSYKEPINYNNIENNGTALFNGINSYIRINGSNTNSDKIFVEFEFRPHNVTKNYVIISKFDWGNPSQKSWEVSEYGKTIVFKISSDGKNEEVLQTGEILALNSLYTIRCEYDGNFMKIFINNNLIISKTYSKGIFKSDTDLMIGAELYNNIPTAFIDMNLNYIGVFRDIPSSTKQIYYAYDFLSSQNFNYTTITSNDNSTKDYKTIVLPYDNLKSYKFFTDQLAHIQLINQQKQEIHNIIILNTNGYGPLLNLFGNITSKTFTAEKIMTSKIYTIDPLKKLSVIRPNSNVDVKAQYINDSISSPLIMMISENKLNLIYINIYPLIVQNELLTKPSLQAISGEIGQYMQISNDTKPSPWFNEPSMLFTKLTTHGNISVTSNSIMTNIANLNTKTVDIIQVNSTEISTQGGYGFYTKLMVHNPTIKMRGNQTFTKITGNVAFLIRQPEISINGNSTFDNFYILHSSLAIFTDGRTTSLQGKLKLQFYVSDKYSIALPYQLEVPITVKYEQPLMQFNETNYLYSLLDYILIVGFIILISLVIVYNLKKNLNGKEQPSF